MWWGINQENVNFISNFLFDVSLPVLELKALIRYYEFHWDVQLRLQINEKNKSIINTLLDGKYRKIEQKKRNETPKDQKNSIAWLEQLLSHSTAPIHIKWFILSYIDPHLTYTCLMSPFQKKKVCEALNEPDLLRSLDILRIGLQWGLSKSNRYNKIDKKLMTTFKAEHFCLCLSATFRDGKVVLNSLQKELKSRSIRRYSSEAFLSVATEQNERQKPPLILDLSSPYSLGVWEFLYCKVERGKYVYTRQSVLQASSFRDWLIPTIYNTEEPLSKYNSRFSLAFTPTFTVGSALGKHEYALEDDIRHENGMVMTDGCGLISIPFMKQIIRERNLSFIPSAVQGRFGNCKGVWMVAPLRRMQNNENLKLICRPSQKKFITESDEPEACHTTMEIMAVPIARKGELHKAAVLFFLCLGVEETVFEDLYRDVLGKLEETLMCPISLLEEVKKEENYALLKQALLAGFDVSDPFVRQLATEYYEVRLTLSLRKYKIPIPQSAYLLMIPDITGTLEPNQIFVQFSQPHIFQCHIVRARVAVYRSPLQLLSDIQIMEAVDCPTLRDIKDCIVFSTRGLISPASLLSGGDYDGDMGWVVWDPRFTCISTLPLIQNQISSKVCKNHKIGSQKLYSIREQDLQEKMLKYCHTQNSRQMLGALSTKLLVVLDQEYYFLRSQGISKAEIAQRLGNNPKISEIAELCTIVVDAPKAGKYVAKSILDSLTKSTELFSLTFLDRLGLELIIPEAVWSVDEDLLLLHSPIFNNENKSFIDAIWRALENGEEEELQKIGNSIRELALSFVQRLEMASLCYHRVMKEKRKSEDLFLLWQLFHREFCKLKANSRSLRETGTLSVSYLEKYKSFV